MVSEQPIKLPSLDFYRVLNILISAIFWSVPITFIFAFLRFRRQLLLVILPGLDFILVAIQLNGLIYLLVIQGGNYVIKTRFI